MVMCWYPICSDDDWRLSPSPKDNAFLTTTLFVQVVVSPVFCVVWDVSSLVFVGADTVMNDDGPFCGGIRRINLR